MEKDGSDNFDIDVEVHYGELDSLILTKTKVVTVVCTYSGFGQDDSAQHSILEGPQAHVEIQSIVGGTVPAGDVNLRIQTVDDQDAVGSIAFDRRYSLFASYTGTVQNVGMKPVSCDAVSDDGERYAVLVAGCGDGFIFDRSDGFITTGTTFRSPYFFAFHLANSGNLAFNCNVTLCSPSCDGSSCETVCGTVTSFVIPNIQLDECSGEKYQDTCTFICNDGYTKTGAAVSTCGADGIWTVPDITCPPKDCGNPPPGTSSTGVASSGTTYTKTADYTCDVGHQKLSGDDEISCLDTGAWEIENVLVCERCWFNVSTHTYLHSNDFVYQRLKLLSEEECVPSCTGECSFAWYSGGACLRYQEPVIMAMFQSDPSDFDECLEECIKLPTCKVAFNEKRSTDTYCYLLNRYISPIYDTFYQMDDPTVKVAEEVCSES